MTQADFGQDSVFDRSPGDTQPSVARLEDDALIEECQRRGIPVARPRDPDGELRANWQEIIHLLRMAEGRVESGAKLVINHPAYFSPAANMVSLTRSAVMGKVEAILASAVVVKESRDAA